MRIALYASETASEAQPREVTWQELVDLLTQHEVREGKSGPAWSPVLLDGTKRSNAAVRSMEAAVFDIDKVWHSDLVAIDQAIERRGLAAILHSTHSHAPPDRCCARLVLQLSRPVSPTEWARFRAAVIADLGLPADPATKDLARLYFLPSHPPGAEALAASVEGAPLDVDAYLASGASTKHADPQPAAVAPTPEPIAGDAVPVDLRELARHLKRCDPSRKELARKILAGEPLADVGGRDDALNQACSFCVWQLPPETPLEAIFHLMRTSIRATPGDEPPEHWEREAKDMLSRAKGRRDAELARRWQENEEILQAAREMSARSDSPATDTSAAETPVQDDATQPYTEEQLAQWAREQGCESTAELSKRWFVVKGNAHYVFVNGRYKAPVPREQLPLHLEADLARAPIDLYMPSKSGTPIPVPPATLLLRHGVGARQLEASLSLQNSYFDARTETFHEAVCPLRPIRPVYHREIDTWLRLLAADKAEKMLDWLATITRLDRSTCALYLHLPRDSGKSLLMYGLARLWTIGGFTEFDKISGSFNESLTKCPLVCADETVQQRPGLTGEIRRFLTAPSRKLSRKFMPDADLRGNIRFILAANNLNLLRSSEDLTRMDAEAIEQRFMYVHPTDTAAADFLRELGGWDVLNPWIAQDLLAEHVTWLARNRQVQVGSRFLVEGEPSPLSETMGSDNASALREFLAACLLDESPTMPKNLVLAGEGTVLLRSEAFRQRGAWERYVPAQKMLQGKQLSDLLPTIVEEGRPWRISIDGKQISGFRRLDVERFLNWAQVTSIADAEALWERIAQPNPTIRRSLDTRGVSNQHAPT